MHTVAVQVLGTTVGQVIDGIIAELQIAVP
jgi:hypothetical protein